MFSLNTRRLRLAAFLCAGALLLLLAMAFSLGADIQSTRVVAGNNPLVRKGESLMTLVIIQGGYRTLDLTIDSIVVFSSPPCFFHRGSSIYATTLGEHYRAQ